MQQIFYIPNEETPTQGLFLATHDDTQKIDPATYGDNVKSFFIEDVKTLGRVGPAPTDGMFDNRPIIIPNMNKDTVLKDSALKTMTQIIQEFGDSIISKYSDAERQSWASKEAAARAFLAGTPLDGTQEGILQTEQVTGGYADRASLVEAVIAKAEQFGKLAGGMSGLRNTITTEIDAAKNQNDLDIALTNLREGLARLLSGK